MKFSTLKYLATTLLLVNGTLAANSISSWNLNDVKQFLKDRKVEVDSKLDDDSLMTLASAEYEKLKNSNKVTIDINDKEQQHLLNLAIDPHSNLNDVLPYHNWDYLLKDKGKPIHEWVFDSWSTDGLKRFLRTNKIKFKKDSSQKQLVDLVKEKFDDITSSNSVSGLYPGDWLYNSWSLDDIKKWLNDYDLPFEKTESREELLAKVKENNYVASLAAADSRSSLFESLKFWKSSDIEEGKERINEAGEKVNEAGEKINEAGEKISEESNEVTKKINDISGYVSDVFNNFFDKSGKIKENFFDSWSYSQLREWLYVNSLIDTKPGEYSDDLDFDHLKKIAINNGKYLELDLKSWLEETSKKADPYLSKSGKNAADVTNETFLVGIDKWSKDRLRDFLKARDIVYSQFNTRHQLINRVKQYKDKPVTATSTPSWLFDTSSTESIRNWLHKQGQNIEGSRQDLLSAVGTYLSTSTPTFTYEDQIKNYKPDLKAYKKYLQKHLGKSKKEIDALGEDAILQTYSIANEYFDSATKSLGDKYKDVKYSVDDVIGDVQDASYEYSLGFLKEYELNKGRVQEHLESARIAANDFSKSVGDSFTKNYHESSTLVNTLLVKTQVYIHQFFQKLLSLFYHHKPIVEKTASDIYSRSSSYAEEVGKSAVSMASDGYKSYKPVVESKVSAAENAYHEYKPVVDKKAGEAYDAAANVASSAYDSATDVAADVASNAYDAATDAATDAASSLHETYQAGKPVVGEAVSNSWNYLLSAWSNADLKSYLQSYGFDYQTLSELNRRQLLKLADAQSSLFYGDSKTKWDKSILDVLKDIPENLQRPFRKQEPTVWDKIKSIF
jgi:Putative stress-responsive nuclear envelope protein.